LFRNTARKEAYPLLKIDVPQETTGGNPIRAKHRAGTIDHHISPIRASQHDEP